MSPLSSFVYKGNDNYLIPQKRKSIYLYFTFREHFNTSCPDLLAAIFQSPFSNAFSLMKCMNFDDDSTQVCSEVPLKNIPAFQNLLRRKRFHSYHQNIVWSLNSFWYLQNWMPHPISSPHVYFEERGTVYPRPLKKKNWFLCRIDDLSKSGHGVITSHY